jgi:hypothetical protein
MSDYYWLSQMKSAQFEQGNEHSVSIKRGNYLERLSLQEVLNKGSIPFR